MQEVSYEKFFGLVLAILTIGAMVTITPVKAEEASDKVFKIGAIPDFDASELEEGFGDFAEKLSEDLGMDVEFVPTVEYVSLVSAFERGEIDLAWFGGLTGVQARALVEEAEAFAQRPSDEKFKSVFIVNTEVEGIEKLADLKGHTFTFGSESSTSGHLMPRYFMNKEGINPEEDLNGAANYSGSHDKTYKLVEAGSFETGAVNMQYWDKAVEDGKVDDSKVKEFYRTDEFYDYNWTINNVDEKFGEGTKDKVKEFVLGLKKDDTIMMELLDAEEFIETENDNYKQIEEVAKELGLIQ